MLTARMAKLLSFIDARLRETGVSPSFDDMAQALDLRSKSGIYRMLTALEERGFIRRLPNRARAIEVIRHQAGLEPSVVRLHPAADPRGTKLAPGVEGPELVSLPHYGRITAAGTSAKVFVEPPGKLVVPRGTLLPGECFALDVRGDAMIEAGILEGDTIIVVKTDRADTGDIVLATIDDEELVLRRLRRRGAAVALEPANSFYETRIFGPDRVRFVGRMCGLIRKYPDYVAEVAARR